MNEREGYLFRPKLKFLITKEKGEILEEIEYLADKAGWTLAEGRRRGIQITIRKTSRGKRDDPSNRDSRAKATLDALKKLGYIVDDSDEWIDWNPVVEIKGESKATIIELWDVA
jgi:hypothetical protein